MTEGVSQCSSSTLNVQQVLNTCTTEGIHDFASPLPMDFLLVLTFGGMGEDLGSPRSASGLGRCFDAKWGILSIPTPCHTLTDKVYLKPVDGLGLESLLPLPHSSRTLPSISA